MELYAGIDVSLEQNSVCVVASHRPLPSPDHS
jgi:hypothetical protein